MPPARRGALAEGGACGGGEVLRRHGAPGCAPCRARREGTAPGVRALLPAAAHFVRGLRLRQPEPDEPGAHRPAGGARARCGCAAAART